MSRIRSRLPLTLLVWATLWGCAGSTPQSAEDGPGISVDEHRQNRVREYQDEAEARLEAGDITEAAIALEQAEMLDPGDPRTLFLLGGVSLAQGDPLAAVPDFRAAWEKEPDRDEYRSGLREALVRAGETFYHDEEYDRAWEVLAEAHGLESSPDLDYLRGLVAYAWARTTETDDRWDHLMRAEEAFRAVLEEEPEDEDARFNLGAVLLALEEYQEAAEIYEELLSRNTSDGGLYLALARAHGLAGDTEAALAEEAIGSALRTGEPVDNPATWASRAADRFPASDLAMAYEEHATPEEVYTYTVPGGSLIEVWFYRSEGIVEAFREGGRIGRTISIAK